MTKTGQLDAHAEMQLSLILGVLRQNPRYDVREYPMMTGDLSREVGKVIEVKLRARNEDVAKIKTHYEGDRRRTVVISGAYQRRLDSYDHGLESLDGFLKKEDYEFQRAHVLKEKKGEEKIGKRREKQKRK